MSSLSSPLVLHLVRGLPGSGKTTYAETLNADVMAAADDYFVGDDGVYRFDGNKIGAAHNDCKRRVAYAMAQRHPLVVVHNTFTKYWEMKDYLEMAQQMGYTVKVTHVQVALSDLELSQRNTHGVPVEVIQRMRSRWQPYPGEEVVDGQSSNCRDRR